MSKLDYNAVSRRVHILFIDRELERFMAPIREFNPHKIYVFVFNNIQEDKNYEIAYPPLLEEIKKFNNNIEIEIIGVRYTEYFEVIQEISKIVDKERKNDKNVRIQINCSTGAKMSSVACVDAARLWNLEIIYVFSNDFVPDRYPKHIGEMKIIIPPTFPIKKPSWRELEALRIINELIEENNKKNLYEDPEDKDYVFRDKVQDIIIERKIISTEGKENKLSKRTRESEAFRTKIMEPLLKNGYIKITKFSKTYKIYLTNEGKRIAQVFKYYNPKF